MKSRAPFYDARAPHRPREVSRFYHSLLQNYYRFYIPTGLNVLEIGCGIGDLLAAVQPARGVGIDFSPAMIELARQRHPQLEFHVAEGTTFSSDEQFDYIILSDLVNDLEDVQQLLDHLQRFCKPTTRLVLNFFNTLWRPILSMLESTGSKSPTLPQNWLSTWDMQNLLHLGDWELIKTDTRILWPANTPLIEPLFNRWLSPLLKPLNLTIFMVARPKPKTTLREYSCTVVIPARNESGNIEAAVQRVPDMGAHTEILFIEGGSKDNTWDEIHRVKAAYPNRDITILKQIQSGKGSAVRQAFDQAKGDILFILDADLTMPPEQLPKFYETIRSGTAEFVNGVRLVYPMENEAMQFLNMIANKAFGILFTWMMGQPIKDTLCGTKVLFREDYQKIAANRSYFGDFDPFGDFDLLFGAAKLNLKIIDLPIRYQARTYGETNINRWSHGWLLLRMVLFAATRLKFIRSRK